MWKILTSDESNKNFLTKFGYYLVIYSIIICIFSIIDLHGDLHSEEHHGTKSEKFNVILYICNVVLILSNLSYMGLSIFRYKKFHKYKLN